MSDVFVADGPRQTWHDRRFDPASLRRIMSALQKIVAVSLLLLLAGTGYGLWSTSQTVPVPTKHSRVAAAADSVVAVDQTTLITAQRLSRLAASPDERSLAQSAERLADHELDLAFTGAMRQIEAHPPVLSPDAQKIQDRLLKSQKLLDVDQASVARLTAAVAQAHGPEQSTLQDQLNLAQSQVELDKDEVEEANQDLVEAGGNLHQRIQLMMQEHSSADHNGASAGAPVADPLASLHGMVRETREWLSLERKHDWLRTAAEQARSSATRLTAERQKLAMDLDASKESVPELAHHSKRSKTGGARSNTTAAGLPQPNAGPAPRQPDTTSTPQQTSGSVPAAQSPDVSGATQPSGAPGAPSLLDKTRQIASDQKTLTLMDQRIADRKQLAGVYDEWAAIVSGQGRSVLHAVLQSVATVLGIILLLLFVDRWLEGLLGRTKLDRRQVETLRSVSRVGLQILGVVIILLVLIGLPGQLGAMIGIAGAGLTVALKDFIVAFIGWLVLMGKNGIRLGDWVEINGVSGEVVQLGMFHTVLLETGNWTDAGHPTGRRVTFTNSFAIQGHYFNFSTSGQWLWDELVVLVPYDRNPHPIADTMYKEVVQATADSARLAEHEWRRSSGGRQESVFSAAPGISVRPAVGGVEIAIRYVTRASERFGLRARLYQSAVQQLAQSSQEVAA